MFSQSGETQIFLNRVHVRWERPRAWCAWHRQTFGGQNLQRMQFITSRFNDTRRVQENDAKAL